MQALTRWAKFFDASVAVLQFGAINLWVLIFDVILSGEFEIARR